MIFGVDPSFDSAEVREEWRAPEGLNVALRALIFATVGIYLELGAPRCRVLRLRGPGIYAYGDAADLAPGDLPGVRSSAPGDKFKLPAWVATRVNLLCPFGDGLIETATYTGDRLTLRAPRSLERTSGWFAEWQEWGATGRRVLRPKRPTVVRDGKREVL